MADPITNFDLRRLSRFHQDKECMRGVFRSFAALCIFALIAGSAAAQQPLEASLSFVSEPNDYIGGGQSRLFTLDSASFNVRGGQNGGYVGVTVFPFAGGFWFLDLAAP